jgi:hypothetical protein
MLSTRLYMSKSAVPEDIYEASKEDASEALVRIQCSL